MASVKYDALFNSVKHEVGSLNSIWATHLVNGAVALENMDNYILAEKAGYDTDGNLTCKALTDATKEGFLVTTVEEDQIMEGETYTDFYNAKDDMVRLTPVVERLRFETSAFELNAGVTAPVKGFVAHFNPATKKFIVSDVATPHASYATAKNKFEVVGVDTDFGYGLDKTTIRLEAK